MEIISKISRGTKMDQIYIPKNRIGLELGTYVKIIPIEEEIIERPFFYNIKELEPVKLELLNKIFNIIKTITTYENIIITGSFLEKGFDFEDIDVLLIKEEKIDEKYLKNKIEDKIKIKVHIIKLSNLELIKGLSIDPLYQMILSKCISKKRLLYKVKNKIDYKLLDLHLLKSELLPINFDYLTGNEKYYLIRNTISIGLFLKNKKISKEIADSEIKKIFKLNNIKEIKDNILDKNEFLKKYKRIHKRIFNNIMKGIRDESKQKRYN